MGINKIVYNGGTLIDLTGDTVTADKLMQGYTAHDRTGTVIIGTATGGSGDGYVWQDAQGYVHLSDEQGTQTVVEPLSVTTNGTYTAQTGHAYSPVTVNVSSGVDIPVFTATANGYGLVESSITCNKTFNQCLSLVTNAFRPVYAAVLDVSISSSNSYMASLIGADDYIDGSHVVMYYNTYDYTNCIVYHSDGTFEIVDGSDF